MTDVLFVIPRIFQARSYKRMELSPPVGILYLASYLKKNGISVQLLDTYADFLSLDDTIREIKRQRPKIVGIPTYSDFIRGAVEIASAIRQSGIDTSVMIGGHHITADKDFYNRFPIFDVAIAKEAEITMLSITKELLGGKKIKGIFDGVSAENLDDLPIPDRDIIRDPSAYYSSSFKGFEKVNIHTSRGCPFQCIFCSSYTKKIRYHSAERVGEEVELCVKKYGTKYISFSDDTFVSKKDRVVRICELIKKYNIRWSCLTRADSVDKELLRVMKDAGCDYVAMGVETGNERLRNTVVKKNIKDKDILNSQRWCEEVGISTAYFFMAGFPTETWKELNDTLAFARKIKTMFFGAWMTVCYPNTEIWRIAVKENKYPADQWDKIARGETDRLPLYYPDGFERDQFLEITKNLVYRYYLHPSYVLLAIQYSFKSLSNMKSMLFYFSEFMKHLFRKIFSRKFLISR